MKVFNLFNPMDALYLGLKMYFFRTLMEGDKQGGFSVFWADDGLDTGPILLQKSVDIDQNETVDTLYNRFLYPEGIKAMVCYIYF